ncbi:DNA primase [Halobacillus halophilus]|uniref:DNA primase n=1 Tax=Halobacillus halophilus (strain ATCC 35676 / DSM 2266 / JCM 20832 / KCTC 3685 / LMG 17431 / NBRC 102448 / NCIMB 2269) TaxID=866895 RepID=I0JP24_HALH3|nr:DNA primase [Halobacillus halophilus]CCG45894.1 DNA primase [Halobacillus halophilus DSM 2266]
MAGHIPEEKVDEIRQSTDIVDIIGDYVELKKQGRNYFGLCPFHGESTPSFSVSADKQIFHCFGCGKGGNVYTFLMEMEGFNFIQAIKQLAGQAQIDLPEEASQEGSSQISTESQSILEAHQWLAKLYHHMLLNSKEGQDAYQYLIDRGFSEETIKKYQIGYSPNSKEFVVTFLEKKGFHPQTMVKAGLLNVNDQGEYADRFRGRLIFPLRNHLGKTVAFAGRSLGHQEPKYLNSPETELFQKNRLLYNFDLARAAIRKQKSVILFEGYVDVISADQAGVHNVVGTMGTSISSSQANLLKRYVDQVIICYDGDQPGVEAAMKAGRLLKNTGCQTFVARVPDGLDPDDFIQKHGGERFKREVLDTSDTFIAFIMSYLRRDYNLQLEGDRIAYIEKVLQEVALLDRAVEREHYLNELASEFQMSVDTLKEEVHHIRGKNTFKQDNKEQNRYTNRTSQYSIQNKLLPAFHNAERKLIAYMLRDPFIAEKVQEELGGAFNISDHQVIVTYLYAYYEDGNQSDVSQFVEKLDDPALKNLVIELAMAPVSEEVSDQEIHDYIFRIKAEHSDRTDIKTLEDDLKRAEQQNEPIKAAEIAMKIIEKKKELKNT